MKRIGLRLKKWDEVIKYVNKQFEIKIDEIFKNFESLNCKLKVSLDSKTADIHIEVNSENKICASSLNNHGKGVIKLIKLIYIINICINEKEKKLFDTNRWNL